VDDLRSRGRPRERWTSQRLLAASTIIITTIAASASQPVTHLQALLCRRVGRGVQHWEVQGGLRQLKMPFLVFLYVNLVFSNRNIRSDCGLVNGTKITG